MGRFPPAKKLFSKIQTIIIQAGGYTLSFQLIHLTQIMHKRFYYELHPIPLRGSLS
jgi:hypothetical protein